jgi:hypothetical protein
LPSCVGLPLGLPIQERRRTPAGTVLAALQTTLVAESPVGPPAHATPALQNKGRQDGCLANQVEQEVRGPGKSVKDGYPAAEGNGVARRPRAKLAPETPIFDVAHNEPVSNYRTTITRDPIIQRCGRGFSGSRFSCLFPGFFPVLCSATRTLCRAARTPRRLLLLLVYLTRGPDPIKVIRIWVHPPDTWLRNQQRLYIIIQA